MTRKTRGQKDQGGRVRGEEEREGSQEQEVGQRERDRKHGRGHVTRTGEKRRERKAMQGERERDCIQREYRERRQKAERIGTFRPQEPFHSSRNL